jgi:hypothetical protein
MNPPASKPIATNAKDSNILGLGWARLIGVRPLLSRPHTLDGSRPQKMDAPSEAVDTSFFRKSLRAKEPDFEKRASRSWMKDSITTERSVMRN